MKTQPDQRSTQGHQLPSQGQSPSPNQTSQGPSPARHRPLHQIAREISASISDQLSARKNPRAPFPSWVTYVHPYLQAMGVMDSIHENYGYDSGYSIVAYFLANAGPWRGPQAKELRQELRAMMEEVNRGR